MYQAEFIKWQTLLRCTGWGLLQCKLYGWQIYKTKRTEWNSMML